MKKRIFAMLLSLLLLLAVVPGAALAEEPESGASGAAAETTAAGSFADVQDSSQYYFVPVRWAVEHGITSGTDSTHFSPAGTCTRAQVVTFLYRAVGKPAVTGNNPFTDVKSGEYYDNAVRWGYQNQIIYGTDDTHFSPNDQVTRAQFITFLWRLAGKPEASGSGPFVDLPENAYYSTAVLWGYEQKIVYGTDDTHFSPAATCTRAQVVTFLRRYLTKDACKDGHTAVADAAVAATCTQSGLTAGTHCSVCGATLQAQTTVPALGHKSVTDAAVAATCTQSGLSAGAHCSVCGTVLQAQTTVPALGHSYTEKVTAPTVTAQGYTTYTCTRCGDSYRDNYTDKLEIYEECQLTVAGTVYYLGQPAAELGTPDEVLKSTSSLGYQWYVYGTETYQDFFAAGVMDGTVVTLVAAGPGFTYQGMQCGDQEGGYIATECVVDLYTDKNDNNIVHAVQIGEYDNIQLGNFSAESLAGESKLNFHLTNAFRAYHGKDPLVWEEKAVTAAVLHSEDMAEYNYFQHDSRSEDTRYSSTSFSARLNAAGIRWRTCGENITMGTAYYFGSGLIAYNSWVNSSGHRTNMLKSTWTYFGVGGGYSTSRGYTYFTQDFWS